MRKAVVPVSMGSPRFRSVEVGPFLITEAWFPPNAVLPSHTHDRPVIGVGLDGAMETRLSGRSLDCQPSSLWVEPAGEAHSNRVEPSGARVVVLQPDLGAQDLLDPARPLLDEVTELRNGAFQSIAARMLPELSAGDGLSRLALEGLCLELLALAGRCRERRRARRSDRWLERAREFAHEHFREDVRLSQLAEAVGVHPAHLSRAFRERFGTSVARYVRALRIAWACEQLTATDLPVGIVALRAGFYDQPHFTRAFKQATGRTPARYRRDVRGRTRG